MQGRGKVRAKSPNSQNRDRTGSNKGEIALLTPLPILSFFYCRRSSYNASLAGGSVKMGWICAVIDMMPVRALGWCWRSFKRVHVKK